MAEKSSKGDPPQVIDGRLPAILAATVAEIDRVLDHDSTHWTIAARPPVIQITQLSLFGLIVLKSAPHEGWLNIFAEAERAEELFGAAYRAGKKTWLKASSQKTDAARKESLSDVTASQRSAERLVRLFKKTMGIRGLSLRQFGISDVQKAIAAWTSQVTGLIEPKLTAIRDPSPAITAMMVVARLAGEAGTGKQLNSKEITLARIACSIGAEKDEKGGPEPKGVKRVRKRLKELASLLPEQQG